MNLQKTSAVEALCERCGVTESQHEGVYPSDGFRSHPFIAARALEVGDVLDSSWGYDQTNVDFYLVTKRTRTTVTLVKVGASRISDAGNDYTRDALWPNLTDVRSEPFRRKIHTSWRGQGECVSITSYANASRWTGEICQQTAAGFGH